jgi:DNA-binding NarL/FixJ family response regulator
MRQPNAVITIAAGPSSAVRCPSMFRLLICDDHPPIRTALRLLAREAVASGCEATECASAEELLAILQQGHPYDFLTLDLQLPGRSGLQVLADVKRLRPSLPVMVFSADESPDRVTEALQAGASSYLCKTASEKALGDALRAAAAHQVSLPGPYVRTLAAPGGTPELPLSARQREVLQCLLRGMSAKQIARVLGISDGTVKSHTVAVFRALNVSSRAQVVLEAHRRGIPFGS